jgi:hypothetical protein
MAVLVDEIENPELLSTIFRTWPPFHDAEVHCVVLNREGTSGPELAVTR